MNDGKSTLSQAQTDQEIGTYWDTHDLSDNWEQTEPVAFSMEGTTQTIYYPVEATLSSKLRTTAAHRGISAETLFNLWLQEKIIQETAV